MITPGYPKFYRKEGRCIWRKSDTTGTEVQLPENPGAKLPLSMSDVIFPTKARFDEAIDKMEDADLECFESYVLNFTGRVEIDIKNPMTERAIRRELGKQYKS